MNIKTEKTASKVFAGIVLIGALVAMVATMVPVVSRAQTTSTAQMQAQINNLLQIIAQLQAQLGTVSTGGGSVAGIPSGFTFTRTLTLGSSGTDVRYLQMILNSNPSTRVASSGVGSPGMESMTFGPLTQSAVRRYQELYRSAILTPMGLSAGTGIVGPSTRTHLNLRLASGIPGVPTTPDDDDDDRGGDLEGGAGSIDSAEYLSGLNNEEVGEGDEDVEVAGLEIEADDGSDIMITAVNINFSQGTADEDFEDMAEEVSVWLDGEEFAREDASEFSDDDDFNQTISLDDGAIIRAGETGELTIAITGLNNIDSQDEDDTWTIEFESIRFEDADGATISDSSTGDINDGTGRTFSFASFASASGVELTIRESNDSPEGQVIDVDESDDTEDVELLIFTMEAEGSDITVEDLPLRVISTGANVGSIINTLRIEIDGEEFSENVSAAATSATVTFDDIDFTIEEGDEVEVTVLADVNPGEDFSDSSTIRVELNAAVRNEISAEDESGEDIEDDDKTGTATGDDMSFSDTGIRVTLVSVDESVSVSDGADNDTGTFRIRYRVEAVDGTIYVADSAVVTTATDITASTISTNGVLYRVEKGGSTAITEDLDDFVTFSESDGGDDSAGGNVELQDGESAEFTLTVTKTNNGDASDNGLYRTMLEAIGWNTNDSSTYNVYDFDLEDFRTDPINID